MIKVFRESAIARILALVGLVVVVTAVITWSQMTRDEQIGFKMGLARWIGVFSPAVALGAAWGWIRLSRSAWLWATFVLVVATISLVATMHPKF